MNYNGGVAFPLDIHDWLISNTTPGSAAFVAENTNEILVAFANLGVSASSELVHLYVNYGSGSVIGWYELNEFDMIEEVSEYAYEELGVPKHFIALTSIEGEGITVYCRKTGHVYDLQSGQIEALVEGDLKPVGETVIDFLRWCISGDV
jgi:hypothetical protein